MQLLTPTNKALTSLNQPFNLLHSTVMDLTVMSVTLSILVSVYIPYIFCFALVQADELEIRVDPIVPHLYRRAEVGFRA